MATVLDTVLLNLGVDKKAQDSWIQLGQNAKDTATVIYKNFKQGGAWDQVGKIFQTFGDSGVRSFDNLSVMVGKLSGRIKNIAGDFTATNIAMQSAAAMGDLLNLRWAEMGNTAKRWIELGGIPVIQTLVKLYIGYRALSFIVGTAINSWQRAGAAMADAVQMNDMMSDSVARLTGNLDGLSHRYVKLADARLYASVGKELSGVGELMQELGISARLTSVVMESFLVKVVTWPAKFKIVGEAVNYLSEVLKSSNKAWLKWMEPEGHQESFRVKLIKNEAKAIETFKNNLQAWSAESGLAPEEITQSWEKMGRVLGEVTTATEILTVAMGNIKTRGNVAPKETLALFEKLVTGIRPTTEELRAFGVELNTTEKGLNTFTGIFDLVINRMQQSAATLDQIQFADKLQKNTHIKLAIMRSDFNDFMVYEKSFTDAMINDSNRLAKAEFKNEEDKREAFAINKQFMDERYTQLTRVVNLVKAQKGLEDAVFGVGITDRFVGTFKELSNLQKHATELIAAGHRQAGLELMEQVREGYTQIYNSIAEQGKSFLDMQQNSIESANRLVRTMGEFSKGTDIRNMGAYIDGMNERAVKSFKQRFDFEVNLFKKMQETGPKQVEIANTVLNLAQKQRDTMLTSIQIGTAAAGEARRGILEIYDLEGSGISTNLKLKLEAYNYEIKFAREMQNQTRANASERIKWLNQELGYRKSINETAKQMIASATGEGAFKPPEQAAQERVADSWAATIAGILKTGEVLKPFFQERMKEMSAPTQTFLQNMAKQAEATRFSTVLMEKANKAWTDAGKDPAIFLKNLNALKISDRDKQIILTQYQSALQSAGAQQLVSKIGGKEKEQSDAIKKLSENLLEAQELAIKEADKQTALLADIDKQYKDILAKAADVVNTGVQNGENFKNFIGMLEATYKIIVADFGGPAGIMRDGANLFNMTAAEFKKYMDARFKQDVTDLRDKGVSLPDDEGKDEAITSEKYAKIASMVREYYNATIESIKNVNENVDLSEDEKLNKIEALMRYFTGIFANREDAISKFAKQADVAPSSEVGVIIERALSKLQVSSERQSKEFLRRYEELGPFNAAAKKPGTDFGSSDTVMKDWAQDLTKNLDQSKNINELTTKGVAAFDYISKTLSSHRAFSDYTTAERVNFLKGFQDVSKIITESSFGMANLLKNTEQYFKKSVSDNLQTPQIEVTTKKEIAVNPLKDAGAMFSPAVIERFKKELDWDKLGMGLNIEPVKKEKIEVTVSDKKDKIGYQYLDPVTREKITPMTPTADFINKAELKSDEKPIYKVDWDKFGLGLNLPEGFPGTSKKSESKENLKPTEFKIETPELKKPEDFALPSETGYASNKPFPTLPEIPKAAQQKLSDENYQVKMLPFILHPKLDAPIKEIVKEESKIEKQTSNPMEDAKIIVNPILVLLELIAERLTVIADKTKEAKPESQRNESMAVQILNAPDNALRKLLDAFKFKEARQSK